MSNYLTKIQFEGAAAIIRHRSRYQPTIGLVLGSGLGSLADEIEFPDIIPYYQIPHWPASTVVGHKGRLVLGKLEGQTVIAMQGRAHYYEGYDINQLALPIRVMNILGVKTLMITNAAGGLNDQFKEGDLMLLNDHINFLGMAGQNPLRGPNDSSGPRFPDLTHTYDKELRQTAHSIAQKEGFKLHEGVYTFVGGPNYETPAELRMLKMMGTDAIGMSTVPSVLVARHVGMRVLGISTITNMALTDPTDEDEVSHDEVLDIGKKVIPQLSALIRGVIKEIK